MYKCNPDNRGDEIASIVSYKSKYNPNQGRDTFASIFPYFPMFSEASYVIKAETPII